MNNQISWNDIDALLTQLMGDLPDGATKLYGVPRGGAVVVGLMLMRDPALSQVFEASEADVLIDDLYDSGATKRQYSAAHPTTPFLVLLDKRDDQFSGKWIEFPWEVGTTDVDMEGCVIRLLEYWGENPAREGLQDTPKRYLKGMGELLKGYASDPSEHLHKHFDIGDVEATQYDQVILSKNIPFVSFCEHHMMPFSGKAHIAYLPDPDHGRVVGLSKLARCLEGYASRFQVQERLTRQVFDAVNTIIQPAGAMVMIQGSHTCQCWRGVKKDGSMITSAVGGVFKDSAAARAEVMEMIKLAD